MRGHPMNKGRRQALSLFLIWLAISPLTLSAGTISFGANESPPYWSKTLEGNGMCGEIVHAISAAVGLTSAIEFMPLKRLINDDSNNDLGNPIFYMETQSFAAIIPIAIYKVNFIYYRPHHKQGIPINHLRDLTDYKTGILKGTLANRSYFSQAGIVFETSYSEDSLIKKMKLGRIDLSLGIDLVAKTSIKNLFPDEIDNFSFIGIDNADSPIAVMISEDYPDAKNIGDKFKEGLNIIIKNGIYQQIIEKYYGAGNIPDNWLKDLEKFNQLYNFDG
jgi:polar amino acid transport system substrate-binding protein